MANNEIWPKHLNEMNREIGIRQVIEKLQEEFANELESELFSGEFIRSAKEVKQ